MSVRTYSLARDGEKDLSQNFKVKEFACRDGTDKILICDNLVVKLQQIRDWAGAPVKITSAYRTKAHNKRVGGVSRSQHLFGKAVDIKVSGKTPREVWQYARKLHFGFTYKGRTFVHVDTRKRR